MTTLALIRKFWPFGVIVALVFVVLFQRNSLTDKSAKIEAAAKTEAQLREANKAGDDIIKAMASARIDNDKIAEAVAARLGEVKTREVRTNTIIKEAKANDPIVRAWADSPIPSRVRDALNTPRDRLSAPAR